LLPRPSIGGGSGSNCLPSGETYGSFLKRVAGRQPT
jgi:hypothetical protein